MQHFDIFLKMLVSNSVEVLARWAKLCKTILNDLDSRVCSTGYY
jgi:hypothetical protein